jgi:hypothetical protein
LEFGALTMLVAKMAAAATCVVLASLVAERTGPLVAAMVATLPISAGPIYAFLALEHDDAFIGEAAVASMSANAATVAYSLAYVFAARTCRTPAALAAAFAGWATTLMAFNAMQPSFAAMLAVTLLGFGAGHVLLRPYLDAPVPAKAPRPWFAIPLRAAGVALLVALVTSISVWAGPTWTGLFATFPVVLTSLIVILQPRLGGKATGAMIGSGVLGLMGFGVALGVVHLTATALGRWPALSLGLAVCVFWNLALVGWSRRGAVG